MKQSELVKAKEEAKGILLDSGIQLASDEEIEITDFGKGNYRKVGLGLVVRLNEAEYASKWLTLLPGQTCPNHYHKLIKETFFIIKGDVRMIIDGDVTDMGPSDKVTLAPGAWHAFSSEEGAVIEEITTHQEKDDSYFEDPTISRYMEIEEE